MRLGGPLFGEVADPDAWARAVAAHGYRAAYCPITRTIPADQAPAFRRAAEKADIVIAEVGAWSNTLSRDDTVRSAAIAVTKAKLDLAESLGARCCVNIG